MSDQSDQRDQPKKIKGRARHVRKLGWRFSHFQPTSTDLPATMIIGEEGYTASEVREILREVISKPMTTSVEDDTMMTYSVECVSVHEIKSIAAKHGITLYPTTE